MRKLAFMLLVSVLAAAQPGETVRALRLKLSAADLSSAESILEVHRAAKGEDAEYLAGLGWLARGALLVGDPEVAARYAARASSLAQQTLRDSGGFDNAPEAAYALGSAIEVEAQCRLAANGKQAALAYLKDEAKRYEMAPVTFRSRIMKRTNLIGLEGSPAPEISGGDGEPGLLQRLAGKPVVLFFWAEWCGDCKAQAAALRSVVAKYHPRGVAFLALTRFYTTEPDAEQKRVDRVWQDAYPGLAAVPVVISEPAKLRYGASATPTFVLVDRKGIVRLYSPTRMTEERLSVAIDSLLAR